MTCNKCGVEIEPSGRRKGATVGGLWVIAIAGYEAAAAGMLFIPIVGVIGAVFGLVFLNEHMDKQTRCPKCGA